MRQQLLARELEKRRELAADVVRVLHVLPPENSAYQQSLTRESHRRAGATPDEVWSRLLRHPDRFLHINPAVFPGSRRSPPRIMYRPLHRDGVGPI